jgi:hypothetical protein
MMVTWCFREGGEVRYVPGAMPADPAQLRRMVQEDRLPQGRRVHRATQYRLLLLVETTSP